MKLTPTRVIRMTAGSGPVSAANASMASTCTVGGPSTTPGVMTNKTVAGVTPRTSGVVKAMSVGAQSIRRQRRRSDQEGQDVLLHQPRGNAHPHGAVVQFLCDQPVAVGRQFRKRSEERRVG